MNKQATYTTDDILKILNIAVYEDSEISDEDIDKVSSDRFEIRNYNERNTKFNNVYVFKIPDKTSKTGYIGMGVSKEYAKRMKQTLETWKNMQRNGN